MSGFCKGHCSLTMRLQSTIDDAKFLTMDEQVGLRASVIEHVDGKELVQKAY